MWRVRVCGQCAFVAGARLWQLRVCSECAFVASARVPCPSSEFCNLLQLGATTCGSSPTTTMPSPHSH
eukprot:360770-Chlamydomonas_euryale.AAC.8